MDWESIEILGQLGISMMIGVALMILSATAGWIVGRFQDFPPVRVVSLWLSRVVLPLLSARSWLKRTLVVFTNNFLVLGTLVALGAWRTAAGRVGVIVTGLSLGTALYLLSGRLADAQWGKEVHTPRAQRLVTVGVLLNLLEIGAIIVVLGLAVGTAELGLPRIRVWRVFAVLVTPTLLVAAGGEALWLGFMMKGGEGGREGPEPTPGEARDEPPRGAGYS